METPVKLTASGAVGIASPQDGNERLSNMLNDLEAHVQESRILMQLGVDNEFVSTFRELLEHPERALGAMAEVLSKGYVAIFWNLTKQNKLHQHINKIGFDFHGSKVILWVFLKEENYNYETRAQIYEMKAILCSHPIFQKIDADLMIWNGEEVELPESYISIVA